MTNSFDSVINGVYNCFQYSSRGIYWGNNKKGVSKFMEIPIDRPVFELPIFTLYSLVMANEDYTEKDTIVAELYSSDRTPRYKTVGRYMQDILLKSYTMYNLIKLKVEQGDNTILYYGTYGAVFDDQFNPVMLCSWIINKYQEDDRWKFKFIQPVLRIDPDCYLNQTDPIRKFIAKKMLDSTLNVYRVSSPSPRQIYSSPFVSNNERLPVKVEICESPFIIKSTREPSISITDKELCEIARNHLEEIAQ